jgi:hypothetical protein
MQLNKFITQKEKEVERLDLIYEMLKRIHEFEQNEINEESKFSSSNMSDKNNTRKEIKEENNK